LVPGKRRIDFAGSINNSFDNNEVDQTEWVPGTIKHSIQPASKERAISLTQKTQMSNNWNDQEQGIMSKKPPLLPMTGIVVSSKGVNGERSSPHQYVSRSIPLGDGQQDEWVTHHSSKRRPDSFAIVGVVILALVVAGVAVGVLFATGIL
jgi:hypothetical protein